MIHYVDNIAKISKTYVYSKNNHIIDKQKDAWVAPQMAQFLLFVNLLKTDHTIPYKNCYWTFSDNIHWNQHLRASIEANLYKLFFSNSYDRFHERKVLIICSISIWVGTQLSPLLHSESTCTSVAQTSEAWIPPGL